MSQAKALEQIKQELPADETYIGAFQGMTRPSFGWHLLIGPLASLLMKTYLVVVTKHKLHFAKQNLLGQIEAIDAFEDTEIRELAIKKNLIAGYNFRFIFNNGRKLKLTVHCKTNGAALNILTPDLLNLIKDRFKCF